MIIIAGSASPKLAARVAKQLKCPILNPEIKRFPDGELYVRLDTKLNEKNVAIVQSASQPQNDNLIELFLLLDAAKDLGARHVTAAVPYLILPQRDKLFKPGESTGTHTICKLIEHAGADDFLTVDMQNDGVIQNFSIPTYNLTAMPLLGQYLTKLKLQDPVILGIDQGSLEHVRNVAAELNANYDYLVKRKVSQKKITTQPKHLEVAKRDVVLVDDIISTGGNIIEATRILRRQRVRKIYVACTHPAVSEDTLQKILKAGVHSVIATDTIEHRTSLVSVAPIIAGAIQQGF
ncbi:MAG: ribose-phosphate diphosphokinase [Candidatus Hadarchaeaceae archaeon]|nr:ribose-phosphate diphosphokinase [Hadesarchaea archaeon]MDH5685660.1 ribose-phosphate diphosphokinase [Hadesarchaea archaeon]